MSSLPGALSRDECHRLLNSTIQVGGITVHFVDKSGEFSTLGGLFNGGISAKGKDSKVNIAPHGALD